MLRTPRPWDVPTLEWRELDRIEKDLKGHLSQPLVRFTCGRQSCADLRMHSLATMDRRHRRYGSHNNPPTPGRWLISRSTKEKSVLFRGSSREPFFAVIRTFRFRPSSSLLESQDRLRGILQADVASYGAVNPYLIFLGYYVTAVGPNRRSFLKRSSTDDVLGFNQPHPQAGKVYTISLHLNKGRTNRWHVERFAHQWVLLIEPELVLFRQPQVWYSGYERLGKRSECWEALLSTHQSWYYTSAKKRGDELDPTVHYRSGVKLDFRLPYYA